MQVALEDHHLCLVQLVLIATCQVVLHACVRHLSHISSLVFSIKLAVAMLKCLEQQWGVGEEVEAMMRKHQNFIHYHLELHLNLQCTRLKRTPHPVNPPSTETLTLREHLLK